MPPEEVASTPLPLEIESKESLSARVSGQLRRERTKLKLTLQEVVEKVDSASGGKTQISAAQLSRIENGKAEPTLEQAYWLNMALGEPLGRFFGQKPEEPWFIVRAHKIEERLKEIKEGTRVNRREDAAHELNVDGQPLYRYVPLELSADEGDDKFVAKREQSGLLSHLMRAYLFEVEVADFEPYDEVFGHHSGEELIYCLDGELEFLSITSERTIRRHSLYKGDCLRFSSELPHAFRALGRKPAQALFVFADRAEAVKTPITTKKVEA